MLVSIVYPCVSKPNNERAMRVKTPMYIYHNKGKVEPFLSNEVVQRYSGDDRVIRRLAPLTKLILPVQADEQRLEPFLYFTADRNNSDSCTCWILHATAMEKYTLCS